jgi:hypothetical protein
MGEGGKRGRETETVKLESCPLCAKVHVDTSRRRSDRRQIFLYLSGGIQIEKESEGYKEKKRIWIKYLGGKRLIVYISCLYFILNIPF